MTRKLHAATPFLRARLMATGSAAAMTVALAAGHAHAQDATAADPAPQDQDATTLTLDVPEVSVTASRTPTVLDAVGSSVTVIPREELQRRQVRFAIDALRYVPGTAPTEFDGGQGQVRLRGAQANQVLVLIDGVRVNNPAFGSEFNFGNLLAEDIERIEVLRGPQSALWGSDAIGGVISVTTRRGEGPTTGGAFVEGGSFGTVEVGGNVGGSGAGYSFSGNATHLNSNGINTVELPGADEPNSHSNTTLSFRGSVDVTDNFEISAVGRYLSAERELDSEGPPVTDNSSTREDADALGRVQADLTLFEGVWQHIAGIEILDDETNFIETQFPSSFEGEVFTVDYQTNVFVETPEFADADHVFTFYYERQRDSADSSSAFGSFSEDNTNNSFAGEYRLSLWDQVFLTSAVRVDNNDFFEDATTYRFTAAYVHPDRGTRVFGNYGTGVKNPTLFELFGFGTNFVPNPNLDPEEARGWEVGVEQPFLDNRFLVGATYFSSEIDDLITSAAVAGRPGFTTSVNLPGTTDIQGVEVTAGATIIDGLDVLGTYTYTDTEDPDGLPVLRVPEHAASLAVNYRFLGDRANINLGVIYSGERDDRNFALGQFPAPRVTVDGFTVVNVAGSYNLSDNVQIFARVDNLFDEDYQEIQNFETPGVSAFGGIRITLGPL